MALRRHPEDQHGNIVADEGMTLCVCGCKYWENDACIDCGMSPERLWIIQHAQQAKVMLDLSLNVKITSWLHYDLPWVTTSISEEYDALAVQERLMEIPDRSLAWERKGDCRECYGRDDNHYFTCSVWNGLINRKVA